MPMVGRGGTSIARSRLPVRAGGAGLLLAAGAAAVVWFTRGGTTGGDDAGAPAFAMAVCEAIVANDEAAFRALHVQPGDLSPDGAAEWVPFAGASREDFEAWEVRIAEA